jgi:hypothetical protein
LREQIEHGDLAAGVAFGPVDPELGVLVLDPVNRVEPPAFFQLVLESSVFAQHLSEPA